MRLKKRYIAGMFVGWQSLDERYRITKDPEGGGLSMCEHPHPMGNGIYCKGNVSHSVPGWEVYDCVRNEYADGFAETRAEAIDILERWIPHFEQPKLKFSYTFHSV
jgi:hypothetical protein